jgi:hypothetical protein
MTKYHSSSNNLVFFAFFLVSLCSDCVVEISRLLHFVPFRLVHDHFVPVILSPGTFCPQSFRPRSFCPLERETQLLQNAKFHIQTIYELLQASYI